MSWDEILERHGRALLLFARQWTPSLADAEDALQDGVLRLYRSRPDAKGPEVLPQLYQVVKWSALDQARSRTRRRGREDAVANESVDSVWFEATLEQSERTADIESAMRGLPSEQREVLVMRIWGDLKFKEIARALEIPPGTAASRYRYGIRALRSALTPQGELCREPA